MSDVRSDHCNDETVSEVRSDHLHSDEIHEVDIDGFDNGAMRMDTMSRMSAVNNVPNTADNAGNGGSSAATAVSSMVAVVNSNAPLVNNVHEQQPHEHSEAHGVVHRVVLAVALLASIVGVVIYVVSATTGYLAGQRMNTWLAMASLVAIVLVCASLFAEAKLRRLPVVYDALGFVAQGLLLVSLVIVVLERVRLAADVYFIPVNYPASEEVALRFSFAAIAAYVIAVLALVVHASLMPRKTAVAVMNSSVHHAGTKTVGAVNAGFVNA